MPQRGCHAPGLTEADRQLEATASASGSVNRSWETVSTSWSIGSPPPPASGAPGPQSARSDQPRSRRHPAGPASRGRAAARGSPPAPRTAQPARACLHGGPGRRVGPVGTPPGQVAVGKREGRAGIGQGAQHAAEHLGHLARSAGAVQQALHAAEPALPDRLHQIGRAVVAGRQHRHGRLLVGGQEAAERVGDRRRLALRCERLVDEGDGGLRIGGWAADRRPASG